MITRLPMQLKDRAKYLAPLCKLVAERLDAGEPLTQAVVAVTRGRRRISSPHLLRIFYRWGREGEAAFRLKWKPRVRKRTPELAERFKQQCVGAGVTNFKSAWRRLIASGEADICYTTSLRILAEADKRAVRKLFKVRLALGQAVKRVA